jgi:hypothetical protein
MHHVVIVGVESMHWMLDIGFNENADRARSRKSSGDEAANTQCS